MKISEIIVHLLAGGILGMFGQVIRVFVGLTKSYTKDTEFSLSRLLGSLAVGFTSGGIGIFTITNWQPDPVLQQGDIMLLLSVGYAGTDFLEGIFRAMLNRTGTADGANIDMQAISRQIAASEQRVQTIVQQEIGAIKTLTPTANTTGLIGLNGENVTILYAANADASAISRYAENVLKDILIRSGHSTATITSTKRTTERQAQVMFHNLRTKGVASQRQLYGPYGDLVIDTYELANNAGKSDDQIVQEMNDRIRAIGPEKLSKHLGDFSKLVVVDIAPSSIANHRAFRDAVEIEKQNQRVSKAITNLVDDPAFHLEIPNREINSELVVNRHLQDHAGHGS